MTMCIGPLCALAGFGLGRAPVGNARVFILRIFYRCARDSTVALMKSGALFPFVGQSRNEP
jgi:hypothetical protein